MGCTNSCSIFLNIGPVAKTILKIYPEIFNRFAPEFFYDLIIDRIGKP